MTTATLAATAPAPSASFLVAASSLSITMAATAARPGAALSGMVWTTLTIGAKAPGPSASIQVVAPESGDQNDFISRVRSVLPSQWFRSRSNPTSSPVVDGILAGIAYCLSWAFSLVSYANLQTRLATATDVFLDMFGLDFLGTTVIRRKNEADDSWRKRISQEVNAPKVTRAALIARLTNLTGLAPFVWDGQRTADTGGYGSIGSSVSQGCFYGGPGAYGSVHYTYQIFVIVYRPNGSAGIPAGSVPDAEIYAEAAACAPAGTTVWTAILD